MLWIITQDKNNLLNVKEIRIRKTANGTNIEGIVSRSLLVFWDRVLGKYDSNERALEVIKEIYEKLEKDKSITTTFTMPKN